MRVIGWCCACLLLCAPGTWDQADQDQETGGPPAEDRAARDVTDDSRYNAVVWMQHAAEYRVASLQAWRRAAETLEDGMRSPYWSADEVQRAAGDYAKKPSAVILDVDETVLDNSAYNARGIVDETRYDLPSWHAWCNEELARAMPGAVEFIQRARDHGVEVFFVTNRRDTVKPATIRNLRKIGVVTDESHVLTRNDDDGRGGDKVSRRATVAKDYRILLLAGDNLSDLCSGMDDVSSARRNAVATEKFPESSDGWILLPNPCYGGWERALADRTDVLRTDRAGR